METIHFKYKFWSWKHFASIRMEWVTIGGVRYEFQPFQIVN